MVIYETDKGSFAIVRVVLYVQCSVISVRLKKSSTSPRCRTKTAPIWMGQNIIFVGYYNDFRVYEDFRSGSSAFKTNDESILKVTRDTFLKRYNQLQERDTNRNAAHNPVQIVPVLFHVVHYENNGCHCHRTLWQYMRSRNKNGKTTNSYV